MSGNQRMLSQEHNLSGRSVVLTIVLLMLLPLLAACVGGQSATETSAEPQLSPDGPAVIAVESTLLEDRGARPLNPGDRAPDFSYTLDDGNTYKLSDLRGNKVLINFWATWCPPCRAEMPDLQAAFNQYADEGFVVLAVNSGETLQQIEEFAQQMGLSMPLITNESGNIGNAYGARGLPTSYFINSDGTIHARQIGTVNLAFIESQLGEMQ